MRSFLFSMTYVGTILLLALSGCADSLRPAASTLSQKQSAYQTPNYSPYHTTAPGLGAAVISSAPAPVLAAPSPLPPTLKAAILLPLTGKNAVLGQAMLNAAQQAVFDAAGNNFELQPHDTAGTGGAEQAARDATSAGAQLIIGPLFATDVAAAMPIASMSGLPMLTLSTDTSLAQRGIYVMGLAPSGQVERIVAYASIHGAHHFAALVPTTPYGVLVGNVFRNAVVHQGGTLVDYETYTPTTNDSTEKIKLLAAQRNAIDALFLPESGVDLKNVADQLTSAGFDPTHTHILGTGLWDVPDLAHQTSFVVGGWYAAPDAALRQNFITAYKAAYGNEPLRLATLAYDATALAAVIAKHGASYDETALTNPNGFAGLDGIFRLNRSGEVERGLAVNEITSDGAKTIDPSPTSFVAAKQ